MAEPELIFKYRHGRWEQKAAGYSVDSSLDTAAGRIVYAGQEVYYVVSQLTAVGRHLTPNE